MKGCTTFRGVEAQARAPGSSMLIICIVCFCVDYMLVKINSRRGYMLDKSYYFVRTITQAVPPALFCACATSVVNYCCYVSVMSNNHN